MVIIILLSVVLLIMGIIILIGKGDNLIAGYNLATEEEKKKYHVKRLRFLIGGLLVVLAPLTYFSMKEPTTANTMSFVASTFVLCIVAVILANTWAKKRK